MAGSRRSSPSPISIGNCKVEIEGDDFSCDSSGKGLLISVSDVAKIKISVEDSRKYMTRKSYNNLLSSLKSNKGGGCFPLEDHTFLLPNPKDVDSRSKSLLQEVLKIYMIELPTMIYAANTGKESLFLERCISSGKYKTLVLRSNSIKGLGEVIAAVSYQIIPSDTQYAEIPLAAVSSNYQNKGIGHLLYKELRERLQNVGIVTIFCWADKESEGFWLKQGFVSVGEVDSKGRARKLPIKADIRRALCFPGGSTLMAAHLEKDIAVPVNSSEHASLCFPSKSHIMSPTGVPIRFPGLVETMRNDTLMNNFSPTIDPARHRIKNTQSELPMKGLHEFEGDVENCCNADGGHFFASGQIGKRRVWEASLSSLKSKRVRGGQLIDCCRGSNQDLAGGPGIGNYASFDDCSLGTPGCKSLVEVMPDHPIDQNCVEFNAERNSPTHVSNDLVSKGDGPKIMFMNIADDTKKTWLTKIVEELGGSVTCDGSVSTHVVTGKARRTLNFCVALCSGAWIVSSNWLKSSFREGKFLDESQFILEDEDYLVKFKSELKDAVIRAKANPHALLRGYHICLPRHIQPSVDVLSAIIKSAGGNVSHGLGSIREPSRTIFLACEEDMEEAMVAAKSGVCTYSSDWFMSCIMKQELDLEAPQFAESL